MLIVVDTLRADRVSHYGHERDTGAGLDELRAHATLFANCRAPAPWTSPSVASLLTGLECAQHRVTGRATKLADGATTLAESLRARGWATAGWTFNHMVGSRAGFGQGYELFDDHLGDESDFPDAEEMVDRIARWLPERGDRPFFLYAQPMNAHGPYRVPANRRRTLLGRDPSSEFKYFGQPMAGIVFRGRIAQRKDVTPRYVRAASEHYETAVRYTLDEVGALLELIEEAGEYDDSLIVVTADHGEELFDHGGFAHGYSLYDEVLRVPLYVKLPGQRDARTVEAPVSLTDVFRTVHDVLGLALPSEVSGRSLRPWLEGEPPPDSPAPAQVFRVDWPSRCIADGLIEDGWKLIAIRKNYEGARDETRLYHLTDDPAEQRDLAAEQPERVARMLERLRARTGELEAAGSLTAEQADLDESRIEALGYADG